MYNAVLKSRNVFGRRLMHTVFLCFDISMTQENAYDGYFVHFNSELFLRDLETTNLTHNSSMSRYLALLLKVLKINTLLFLNQQLIKPGSNEILVCKTVNGLNPGVSVVCVV